MDNYKQVIFLGDMIQGSINRICVSNDLEEIYRMVKSVKSNIDKLVSIREKDLVMMDCRCFK